MMRKLIWIVVSFAISGTVFAQAYSTASATAGAQAQSAEAPATRSEATTTNTESATATPGPTPSNQTAAASASGVEAPATSSTAVPASATATTSKTTTTASTTATKGRTVSAPYWGIGVLMQNIQGYTGLMPKVFVGYSYLYGPCKEYYWGVEAAAGLGTWPLSPNQRHRVGALAGVSVLPGFMMDDWTLLYARIGAQAAYYSKLDRTRVGVLVGVGFETYVDEHWDLRAEYAFNTNRNFNQYSVDFVYKFC